MPSLVSAAADSSRQNRCSDVPDVHAGKDYWLSTDVLNGVQAAEVLSGALGTPVAARVMTPDDLERVGRGGERAMPASMEPTYAASAFEWLRQTYDGRMDHAAVTTTTIQDLLGRPPVHLADWATANRDALLAPQDS